MGSRIFLGGYLFGVFILGCYQHMNRLTAVLNINRFPQPVLGHHPLLVFSQFEYFMLLQGFWHALDELYIVVHLGLYNCT